MHKVATPSSKNTMELVTTEGVVFNVSQDFITKSQILTEILSGCVRVPISSTTLKFLMDGTYPDNGPELLAFAKAADFLHMETEIDEACRRIAESLKGKSAIEIRKFLDF
jgi:hypothetical protein